MINRNTFELLNKGFLELNLNFIYLMDHDLINSKNFNLRDLDLLLYGHYDIAIVSKNIIAYLTLKHNYKLINLINNDYSVQLYFYDNGELIHIDLMPNLSYRGLNIIEYAQSDVVKIDVYPLLNEGKRLVYMIIREYLLKGKISNKYRSKILSNLTEVEKALSVVFSISKIKNIIKTIQKDEIICDTKGIKFEIIKYNFKIYRFTTIVHVYTHVRLLLNRFFNYPGILIYTDKKILDIPESLYFEDTSKYLLDYKTTLLTRIKTYLKIRKNLMDTKLVFTTIPYTNIDLNIDNKIHLLDYLESRAYDRLNKI